MVEGWVLVISKQHVVCMGAIRKRLEGELRYVVGCTRKVVTEAYGAPTLFEHGPSVEGTSIGCGVDHAHFHLVPLSFSLLAEARLSPELGGWKWNICEGEFGALRQLYRQGKSYLYIGEPGCGSVYCTPQRIPCQSLRRVIAGKVGLADKYDYKRYPFKRRVESTLEVMRDGFAVV
jgi:hypothetical protein